MRKIIVISLMITFLLLSASTALADHYEYFAQDPAKQSPDFQGTENYAFYWWALFPSDIWWKAEALIYNDVKAAITNWESSVPELDWREEAISPDVLFKYASCPGFPTAAGCTTFTDFTYDSVRDASYWMRADVYVNPNYTYGPGARKGTIAHEAGHLYGLHERWIEGNPPSCNNDETTVMDAAYVAQDGKLYHCDGLQGPALADDIRVTAYWSQGEYVNFQATSNGTLGIWFWEDAAWAEFHHWMQFFYWDGSQWIEYHNIQRAEDVGVHRDYETRELREIVNRLQYGAPAGTHIACGHPYFEEWPAYGTWRCSNMISLY